MAEHVTANLFDRHIRPVFLGSNFGSIRHKLTGCKTIRNLRES